MLKRKSIAWKNLPPKPQFGMLWVWAVSVEVWQIETWWAIVGYGFLIGIIATAVIDYINVEQIDILK